ncbi:hypothetical protein MHK_003574, partial [Candidatus Magnetomorum sp. HK-1]
ICWFESQTEYIQAIYNASNFKGYPNISFRWILKVKDIWDWLPAYYEIDGISIDDFEIEYQSYTPTISDITNQTVAEGKAFTAIALDQFVSDGNHSYTEITWTASGQSNLSVNIDSNRVATITAIDSDWNGSESIIFVATDPAGYTASDIVTFTITPVNDSPVVSEIQDQAIAEGNDFTSINLDDFVSDVDNTDAEISWTATGQSQLTITIENRIANIILPNNDWNGSETILFTATDTGSLTSNSTVVFTVTPVNDPPQITDIENQNISEGNTFASITLDNNRHIINRHYSKNDCIRS